ncbi:MAG: hypothetical protein JRH16_22925 [Deltaproteobacteria bacterium]|nr:hypothetical protein [Deltaproteobacteria bacterium]
MRPTPYHPATSLLCAGLTALIFFGGSHAIAANRAVSPDDVKGPFSWGEASRVTQLGDLFFADQPDRAGFEQAREAGVEVVINLRAPGELDWDEPAAAKELGLTYYNVPITGPRFDPEAIARIDALVSEHEGSKVLVHCGSSNRVGGWLATHLITQGMSTEDAIVVGRRAGITKQGIVDRVETWVSETSH